MIMQHDRLLKVGIASSIRGKPFFQLKLWIFYSSGALPRRQSGTGNRSSRVIGRNNWFKRCKPELYDMVFSEGDEVTFTA